MTTRSLGGVAVVATLAVVGPLAATPLTAAATPDTGATHAIHSAATDHGARSGVPDRDTRFSGERHRPTPAQRAAARDAGASVTWGETGTAHSVVPGRRPLTGPDRSAGRGPGAADRTAREYLRRNPALFGLSAGQVAALRLTGEDTDAGVTFLRYQQVERGRDVFGATGLVVVDDRGRVLTAGGDFVPDAGDAPAPSLEAADAVAAVSGAVAPRDDVRPGRRLGERNGKQRFENNLHVPDFAARAVEADLVTVATEDGPRSAWRVHAERASNADYVALVDAGTGEVLFLDNQVSHDGPEGTVFTGDDPDAGARTVVDFPAVWVDGQTTAGNNTNTYQDAEGDNATDADGSDQPQAADAHFNYPWNDPWGASPDGDEGDLPLTGPDRDAVVTQLFYYTNWFHDYAYDLGFTETSGNFQNDNFGNGGSDGDAVEAESDANFLGDQCDDDGTAIPCRNNANWNSNGPDGTKPRMQMYVGDTGGRRTQRANNRDTVIHEYVHGVTGRIISDGNLAGGIQSGALGEGWSDSLATSINDDPVYGEYNNGNTTRGIRSAAYDQHVRTYADMCQRATDDDGNPICQVHTDGELWAQMMWEVRTSLRTKYDEGPGKDKHERLMVLGMKLTPNEPSFADARNGYLLADWAMHPTGSLFVGANSCRLWRVFADNDLGTGSNDADDVSTPTISTDTPAACDPVASIAPVASQQEGADIAFDATASAANGDPGDTLAHAWDLDDDGQYDDSTSATPTWAYGDNGSRTVGLQVTNSSGYVDTAEVTFDVTNVAPTVTIDLTDLAGMEENDTRTVAATFSDPGWLDSYSGNVDLGTTYLSDVLPTVSVYIQGGKGIGDGGGATPDQGTADAQVTFGDNGTYTVTVEISDDDSGLGNDAGQATVLNVAPTAEIDTSGEQVYDGISAFLLEAGENLTVPADSEDPGSDDLAFEWDWDGAMLAGETPDEQTSLNDLAVDPDPALSPSINPRDVTLQATHAYADACLYDLEVTVTDDDAGTASDSAVVLVTGNADVSKGSGWWLNQYRDKKPNDFTPAQLQCYLDIVNHLSLVFSEERDANDRSNAADVLNAPSKAPAEIVFDQHLLAAWLNLANGAVKLGTLVDTDGDGVRDTAFGEVVLTAETVRADPTATEAQIETQKNIVERISTQSAP